MYPSCDSETVPAAMSCLTLVPSTAGTSLTSPSSTHTYLACSAPSTSACSASDDSRWISPSVASPAMAHASPSRRTYRHGSATHRVKPMPPSHPCSQKV